MIKYLTATGKTKTSKASSTLLIHSCEDSSSASSSSNIERVVVLLGGAVVVTALSGVDPSGVAVVWTCCAPVVGLSGVELVELSIADTVVVAILIVHNAEIGKI